MVTTYDLHLFSAHSEYTKRDFWNNLDTESEYEKTLNLVMDRRMEVDWLKNFHVDTKKKLLIAFGGMNLTMLDDVFDTNSELLKVQIHPLTTTQFQGYKASGMSKFYANMDAMYFNYASLEWEPMLENFGFAVSLTNTEDEGKLTEVTMINDKACINLTTELVTILKGIQNQRNFRTKFYEKKLAMTFTSSAILKLLQKTLGDSNIHQHFENENKEVPTTFDKLTAVKDEQSLKELYSIAGLMISALGITKDAMSQSRMLTKSKQLSLRKSPLSYNFIESNFLENNRKIAADTGSSHLTRSHQFNYDNEMMQDINNSNILSSKRKPKNVLAQSYHLDQNIELPDKEKLRELLFRAKKLSVKEINLQQCPYQVQNFTGEDILLVMSIQKISGYVVIPNLKLNHVPFPSDFLNHLNATKQSEIHTNYMFYIIERNTFKLTFFYQTRNLS